MLARSTALSATLCAVCLGLLYSWWPARAAAQGDPTKGYNEAFYRLRSSLSGRRNGAQLTATVSLVKLKGQEMVRIDWTLEYTGDRWPFVIVEPSLEKKTYGQTEVIFYAEGKDREIYSHTLRSPILRHSPISKATPRDQFLILDKGKNASGRIHVPVKAIRNHFVLFQTPVQFVPYVVPPLYVQLRHAPDDRGIGHQDLDAWTGRLYSRVLKVPLADW